MDLPFKQLKGSGIMSKKIAICSTNSSASSQVDERFGRCSYFVIWDPETNGYEILSNTGSGAAHGAGTGAVQALIKRNVGIVISHRVGPNAFTALEQAQIKIFSGVAGKSVEEALQSYQAGELHELLAPNN
jgi:predicted Fe-Mo cluster-binding NifX family protein